MVILADELPSTPAVSSFAPADDLLREVHDINQRLATLLSSRGAYTPAKKKRVFRDAQTLVVLLMALGLHDEDNGMKRSAPVRIALAQQLADVAGDYGAATTAYQALMEVDGDIPTRPLQWQTLVGLEPLMEQVSMLNANLRRSVRKRHFEKRADRSTSDAAALAVIAQAIFLDTHEVKNTQDKVLWRQFSVAMREAAAAANAGIHAGDYEATQMAIKHLTKSCDSCHEVFHKVEN